MKRMLFFAAILLTASAQAGSHRIEVYPTSQALPQTYYDVKSGDTLGGIAQSILPGRAELRASLMRRLVEINPDAFINHNPDQLKAHVRLWLPDEYAGPGQSASTGQRVIQQFSWGYISKPRR